MIGRAFARWAATLAVRLWRPHWVRDCLEGVLGGIERFAPIERLSLPPGRLLSVVAPHPDDESIGCGGLIAMWSAMGRPAQVVFLTNGEMGSQAVRDPSLSQAEREELAGVLRRTRRAEAEAALEVLGAVAVWFDGADGALHRDQDRLADRLTELWQAELPALVAAPDPADRHADHAVAARIVGRAALRCLSARARVLGYEVWSPAPANVVLDISAVAEAKWHAIGKHQSQTATSDYVAAASALNRYRAITSGQALGFAEAFRQATVSEYAATAEKLRI